MKPRGTARFALGLIAGLIIYKVIFELVLSGADSGWVVAAGVVLMAVLITVAFTAIYDGPRALLRVLAPSRNRSTSAGDPEGQ